MIILEILSMISAIGSFAISIIALTKITSINKLIMNLKIDDTVINTQLNSPSTNQSIKRVKASGDFKIAGHDIKHE